MPETITTRCPSWARSKHRSLMTRVSGGFRSSGKKSPFTEVAILGYPTVQFKKADSFGFEPRRAAIGEKRPKNRGRMRALCQEMWSLSLRSGLVDLEWTIRRRRIWQQDLLLIRELIGAEGHRGRSYISNRLCEIWDWRQDNGRLRQIACRDLLRQLEGKGLVKLPPMLKPARRAGYVNRVPALDLLDQSRLAGPLPSMREELRIDLVEGVEPARAFKGLIGPYHYLGYQQAKGAQVKYLVTYRERPVACLSFGPAAFKVAARDQFIGWSVPQRQARLAWVVNNDRFLLLPWVEVPNLASFVLSRCVRRLRSDWQRI